MSSAYPSSLSSQGRIRWVSVLMLFTVLSVIEISSAEDAPKPRQEATKLVQPPVPANGYVGSQACADCHAEIWESYQRHPMAQSAAEVLAAKPLEDYVDNTKFTWELGNRQFHVEKTNETVYHHEQMVDHTGEPIYDQSALVTYAIGSGVGGRSYLIDRDGIFFQSPISWFTSVKRWDISPGYVPKPYYGFERRITPECVDCHFGRPSFDRGVSVRYHKQPFVEVAIGCERCHGPGNDHVAHYQDDDLRVEDAIVNPARLDSARRDSVCYQCHLSGEARILRYGRTHHDFRPGDRLEDIWTVFVSGTRTKRIDGKTSGLINSQVEQMRSSVCYQMSEGAMGCISCHDPHSRPPESQHSEFYRMRCMICHQERGCSLPVEERQKSANSCIHCHMPRLSSEDIPHSTNTDHRILRTPQVHSEDRPPRKSLTVFDQADTRMSRLETDRARGLLMTRYLDKHRQLGRQIESLLLPVSEAVPEDISTLDSLGKACLAQGRAKDAQSYWEQALEIDPKFESVLSSLAVLHLVERDFKSARLYQERLLAINPWTASAYSRHAEILSQLGHIDAAMESAERCLELDPSSASLHAWLAKVYEQQGRTKESLRHLNIVRQLSNQQGTGR